MVINHLIYFIPKKLCLIYYLWLKSIHIDYRDIITINEPSIQFRQTGHHFGGTGGSLVKWPNQCFLELSGGGTTVSERSVNIMWVIAWVPSTSSCHGPSVDRLIACHPLVAGVVSHIVSNLFFIRILEFLWMTILNKISL